MHTRSHPLGISRVIVEASLSTRRTCMSMEHQRQVDNIVDEDDVDSLDDYLCPFEYSEHVDFRYQKMLRLIPQFIQVHREFLIEASTMIEMALWMSMLNDSPNRHQNTKNDRTIREEMRVKGGSMFHVVIPNVLSFL